MCIQKNLLDWAKKVLDKYDKIAEENNMSYYTQSNLLEIKKNPQVLILGINPGSKGGYKKIDENTFLKGNDCFTIGVNWHFWNGLKKIFEVGGIDNLLKDKNDFVFSNIFHYGTLQAKDLPNEIKKDKDYVSLTINLIRILNPQMVVCLGRRDCMFKLIAKKTELIEGELSYGMVDDIPIYGIPHTSKFYTNEECVLLGKVLASLYKKEVLPMKETIKKKFKTEITAFETRRDEIKPQNICNSMIEFFFKKYVRKESWNKEKDWYEISSNFIVKVTSSGGGYISIRDSKFDKNNNYSKRIIDNQDAIIKYLEEKGYELKNDGARNTSLGHKPFEKYAEWKQGPQHVVLSILREIEELGPELEDLYNKKEI